MHHKNIISKNQYQSLVGTKLYYKNEPVKDIIRRNVNGIIDKGIRFIDSFTNGALSKTKPVSSYKKKETKKRIEENANNQNADRTNKFNKADEVSAKAHKFLYDKFGIGRYLEGENEQ